METQNIETQSGTQDHGAYNFFLYLLVFLSLIFVAIGEGSILFGFIDKFISSKSDQVLFAFDQSGVRFGIAALFIASPIFFAISFLIAKRITQKTISLESTIRKWLTYIVLFFAAATAIGDLITLVVNFLGGDFTASFLLKVLVIIVIAGGIFAYYFWDMRRNQVSSGINKIAMIASVFIVLVTLFAGFFIIDSPAVSKQKSVDQKTTTDLQSVDNSIQNYFDETGKLPVVISDLKQTKFSISQDNINGFSYSVKDDLKYELCANFSRSNFNDARSAYDYDSSYDWKHESGKFCFTRAALKKADIAPINAK